MKKKTKIIFLVILILLVATGILKINNISLFGIGFAINEDEKSPTTIPSPPQKENIKDIEIISFYPELEYFSTNTDNATVNFLIENNLHVPYNLTVEFYFGDRYINKWSNTSTKIYPESFTKNYYYSFIPTLNLVGDWTAQLSIEYTYQNKTFRKSKTTYFKVVDKTPTPIQTTFYPNGSTTNS